MGKKVFLTKEETENISNFSDFKSKKEANNFKDMLKKGTLSGHKVKKNGDFVNSYLIKYNINTKKEFGMMFNAPIIPESLYSITISILILFSQYNKALYFDYTNQDKLEVITSKLLKILNKDKYRDSDIKYLENKKNKPIGAVIKLLDARNVVKSDFSEKISDENKKSFIETLAEAFILDICDRTTIYNMMIYKNQYINIDYGIKYTKSHTKVIKKFCKNLTKCDIEKAKKIFLSELKDETAQKVRLLKVHEFFSRKSNAEFIDERKSVYSLAKSILDKMPDAEFIKIFENLLNKKKVNEMESVFKKFYDENPRYKNIHCDIAQSSQLILKAINEYQSAQSKS